MVTSVQIQQCQRHRPQRMNLDYPQPGNELQVVRPTDHPILGLGRQFIPYSAPCLGKDHRTH
jgi:hypothetical protein